MDKVIYPTGVENHGGTLRIWFNFKGKRVRASVSLTPLRTGRSPGNCGHRYALPSEQAHLSTRHSFRTPNLKTFGVGKKEITVSELAEKWLDLKRMEICANALNRYESVAKNMVPRIGVIGWCRR